MIRVKTKKGGNWVHKVGNVSLEDEKKRKDKKLTFKLFCLVIMSLFFVAVKISLFVMIGKFIFQQEDNLFGFPVKMFSFTKTYWSRQHNEQNLTEKEVN